MRDVFVTGATGLVGSYLVKDLLENNYSVTASKRELSSFQFVEEFKDQVNWVELDVTNIDDTISLFEQQQFDIVIHAAAVIDVSKVGSDKTFKINVKGTENLVNVCLESDKKPTFVFVSSISAVGDPVVGNVVKESDKWNNDIIHSTYAESKYYSELEVWRGMEEGLDVLVLNPAVILGVGSIDRGSGRLISYAKSRRKWILDGDFNYVDVRDVTGIIIKLIDKKVINTRFILSSGQVAYKDFFEECGRVFNVKAPSKILPISFLRVICKFGELMKFFGFSFSFDDSFYQMVLSKKSYSSDKIKEVLPGFTFRSLRESLAHISER